MNENAERWNGRAAMIGFIAQSEHTSPLVRSFLESGDVVTRYL